MAKLKSGNSCTLNAHGGHLQIRCDRNNALTAGFFDTVPRLHNIDGTEPKDFVKETGAGRFHDNKFEIGLPAGSHTLLVSFHYNVGAGPALTSDDLSVSFVALAGHLYELNALIVGKGQWSPMIADVTQKSHPEIVSVGKKSIQDPTPPKQ